MDINILSRGDNKKANKVNNRKKRNEETKKRDEIEKKRTTKIRNRS